MAISIPPGSEHNLVTTLKPVPFNWGATGTSGAVGAIAQEIMPVGANGGVGITPLIDWKAQAFHLKANIKRYLETACSLLPLGLRNVFWDHCILSGSSISSIYHGEQPKDFDFWVNDESLETIARWRQGVIDEYSGYILDISETYGDGNNAVPCVTANAITFKNKFQLITLGDYHSERKKFDFLHCLPYYDLRSDKFYISESQLTAIREKKLILVDENRKASDIRTQKFMSRGWSVNVSSILKTKV